MKPYNIDVAVLILFFNRPDTLKKVFESVKKARPSRLYLYQDGPRANRPDDLQKIEECRRIVADIDWVCETHQYYSEVNLGCDPSEYIAQKWMFETEEMGIILEDDDVPSQSFFYFCKELLEKYKDDTRINMICGYNVIDNYKNSDADYFFSSTCSIWGWASWKRVLDSWDPEYKWLEDDNMVRMYLDKFPSDIEKKKILKTCKWQKYSGKAYYETICSASMHLNNRLAIIPTHNMINNIGVGVIESTHSTDNIKKISPWIRKLFNKEIYEYNFPLKHPEYVCNDTYYKKLVDKMCGNTKKKQMLGILWRVYAKIRFK